MKVAGSGEATKATGLSIIH